MNDFKWEELLFGTLNVLYLDEKIVGTVSLVTHIPIRWSANYTQDTDSIRVPDTENFEQLNDAKQALENWIINNK